MNRNRFYSRFRNEIQVAHSFEIKREIWTWSMQSFLSFLQLQIHFLRRDSLVRRTLRSTVDAPAVVFHSSALIHPTRTFSRHRCRGFQRRRQLYLSGQRTEHLHGLIIMPFEKLMIRLLCLAAFLSHK